jgi:hypothetical protein
MAPRKIKTAAQSRTGDRKGDPPMPNVRQPPAWSFASQQLLSQASYKASSALVEELYPDAKGPYAQLGAQNEVGELITKDRKMAREYYARVVHFLTSEVYKGKLAEIEMERAGGLPKARAEAKLYCWLKYFSGSKAFG